jgi:hypothetical protein
MDWTLEVTITFFGLDDPDGNSWAVQELKVPGETPLIPVEHHGRFGA